MPRRYIALALGAMACCNAVGYGLGYCTARACIRWNDRKDRP